MKHILIITAVLCVFVAGAMAETTVVPTNYATISAALAGIDRTDGAPDTINVETGTITEGATIDIAPSDELTINGDNDGNGNCVVVFTAVDQGYGVIVQAASDEDVTINNLTLIPQYAGVGVNDLVGAAMLLDDDPAGTGATTTITVSGCVVSSSSTGEAVSDPDAAPPSDYTRWNGSASQYMYGVRVNDTSPSSELTFELVNVKVAHGLNRGFYIRNDAGTTCNMTDCTARYATGGSTTGIRCFSLNGTWNVTDCESTNNGGDHALEAASGAGDVVINGGVFGDCAGGYNMNLAHEGTVTLNGTADEPIVCRNGANRGIRFNDAALQLLGMDYVVVASAGVYGVSINEWDGTVNPTLSHVAVIDSAGIIAGSANFDNGDSNTGAVSVGITDSTFTNNGGATGGSIRVRYGADKTINATRCIFDGHSGQYAMGASGGADAATTVLNATDCAFSPSITPFAAALATTSNTNGVTASAEFASVNYSDVTQLASTGDFLRPTNTALGAASTPGGVDILGYSTNGTAVPVELSIFSTN